MKAEEISFHPSAFILFGDTQMTDARVLAPYRVLDLTDENGWLCGRILGDLGADVIKVEPPTGDPARRKGPFYHDLPDPEKSLPWFAYNANKRGITLDLESAKGQDALRRLSRRADFVIESFAPGDLDVRGVGYHALSELNPRLVFTSITPFGQTGPYAHYRGCDVIAMAMSGFMSFVGEPGKPPLRVTLAQAPMWASMYAAAGTLIAHHHRQKTGQGQHVDVSMQAGILWALANAPAFWSLNRENLQRAGAQVVGRSVTGARMRAIYPCRDGHINFIIYGGEAGKRSNEAMVEWMAEQDAAPDWLKEKNWDAFNVAAATQEEIDAIETHLSAFLAQRTKVEFAAESVKRGILGYPVNNARDICGDPQLEAREFWHAVEHPELNATLAYAGAFAKFSATPITIRRRAPRVGEHNEQVYLNELELSRREFEELKREGVL
jgi:crotonobetainyl-CoA:carnitine CoA-transferase CaiB-like acyl-CoA transferase